MGLGFYNIKYSTTTVSVIVFGGGVLKHIMVLSLHYNQPEFYWGSTSLRIKDNPYEINKNNLLSVGTLLLSL